MRKIKSFIIVDEEGGYFSFLPFLAEGRKPLSVYVSALSDASSYRTGKKKKKKKKAGSALTISAAVL